MEMFKIAKAPRETIILNLEQLKFAKAPRETIIFKTAKLKIEKASSGSSSDTAIRGEGLGLLIGK